MPENASRSLAIACSAGGFKGVFVHGVLSSLEAAGVRANAYAAASSSVFPSICAVIRQAGEVGLRYWRSALGTLEQPGNGMSEVVLASIAGSGSTLFSLLFRPDAPRFFIATSVVKTIEGAEQTQGDGARRLGRRLLLQAARGDRSWADEHLRAHLFDSAAPDEEHHLTIDNINEVITLVPGSSVSILPYHVFDQRHDAFCIPSDRQLVSADAFLSLQKESLLLPEAL